MLSADQLNILYSERDNNVQINRRDVSDCGILAGRRYFGGKLHRPAARLERTIQRDDRRVVYVRRLRQLPTRGQVVFHAERQERRSGAARIPCGLLGLHRLERSFRKARIFGAATRCRAASGWTDLLYAAGHAERQGSTQLEFLFALHFKREVHCYPRATCEPGAGVHTGECRQWWIGHHGNGDAAADFRSRRLGGIPGNHRKQSVQPRDCRRKSRQHTQT